ncbi:DUF3995 domain-containing protein [Dactylosporangium sp. CA-139066]|uniref:DUF3995 domain-containing protein n=1 Tax=Dactylosporangium sp. CA-139066 TaxID=3239930 RepID=UPI003D8D4673
MTTRGLRNLDNIVFGWVAVFAAFHVYWELGGHFGFGDAPTTVPTVDSAGAWVFTGFLAVAFIIGAAVPLALYQPWGARLRGRALIACCWIGGALLTLRGAAGLLDTLVRASGLSQRGITGLTYEQEMGVAHPNAYTLWSSSAIDLYFLAGGLLYCALAVAHRHIVSRRVNKTERLASRI